MKGNRLQLHTTIRRNSQTKWCWMKKPDKRAHTVWFHFCKGLECLVQGDIMLILRKTDREPSSSFSVTHQYSDPPGIWHSASMEHEPRQPYLSNDRLWTEHVIFSPNCTGSCLGLPQCITVHRMQANSSFALIVHLFFMKFTSLNIVWTSLSCHCSIWVAGQALYFSSSLIPRYMKPNF